MNESPLFVQNPFEAPLFFKEVTGSTMEEARRQIDAPRQINEEEAPRHGSLHIAGYQTRGRGRFSGRKWEASRQENLLMTLILDPDQLPFPPARLPLMLGLGLWRFFSEFSLAPRIKWPNDILIQSKKISGILCESYTRPAPGDLPLSEPVPGPMPGGFPDLDSPNNLRKSHHPRHLRHPPKETKTFLLAGLGVNINQTRFPSPSTAAATSLSLELRKTFPLSETLSRLLLSLYETFPAPNWRQEIESVLWKKDQEIRFLKGLPPEAGQASAAPDNQTARQTICQTAILRGIDEDGRLLLEENGKIYAYSSGEIHGFRER